MSVTKIVEVTKEDIKKGYEAVYLNAAEPSKCCPNALALQRTFNDSTITVTYDKDKRSYVAKDIELPIIANNLAKDFDSEYEDMVPISYEFTL